MAQTFSGGQEDWRRHIPVAKSEGRIRHPLSERPCPKKIILLKKKKEGGGVVF
jgi:hypothetical protein